MNAEDVNEHRALYEYAARMNGGTFVRLDDTNPDSLLPVIVFRCSACGRLHRTAVHFYTITMPDAEEPPVQSVVSEEAKETRTTTIDLSLDERIEQMLKEL